MVTKQISEIELALISNEQRLDFLDIEDYILQSERKFESINNITVKIESEIGQSEQRINELDKKIADYDKTTNDLPAIEERFQTIMNRIEQVNSSLEKTGEKCELLTEGQHLLSLQQNTTFTDLLRVSSEINESKTRYALLGADLVQNFTQFDTRLADQSHSIQSNFDSIAFLTTSLRNQYMKFSPQITNFEERIDKLENNQILENEVMRLNTRQSLLSEQINDVKSQVNIMKVELGSKMANISEIQADHKTRFENLSDFNPIRHKVCETQCRIVGNRQRCFIYGCGKSTKDDYCDGNNDCQNGLLCENRYFLYFSKYALYSSLKPMHPETSQISACWWSKAGESAFRCVPSIRRCNN